MAHVQIRTFWLETCSFFAKHLDRRGVVDLQLGRDLRNPDLRYVDPQDSNLFKTFVGPNTKVIEFDGLENRTETSQNNSSNVHHVNPGKGPSKNRQELTINAFYTS